MATSNPLASALDIERGEGHAVSLIVLVALFTGIGAAWLNTVSHVLFLARFSAEMLPYVYIGSGVVVAAVGVAYLRLEESLSEIALLGGTLVLLIAGNLLLYLVLLAGTSKWLVFVLVFWDDLLTAFVGLTLWKIATAIFDDRQGKRLFGLINTSDQAAWALGAFAVPVLMSLVGVVDFLVLASISMVGGIVALVAIVRTYRDKLTFEEGDEEGEAEGSGGGERTGWGRFFSTRYEVLMIAAAAMSLFAFYFLDLAFFEAVAERFDREVDLAWFLGIYNGVTQTIIMLASPLLSGRILTRFGLQAGLTALPVATGLAVLGLLAVAAVGGTGGLFFILLIATKGLEDTLRNTIDAPSTQLLYQPLPGRKSLSMQTFIGTIVTPVAGVAAGVALLAVGWLEGVTLRHLLGLLLLILMGWALTAFVLSKDGVTRRAARRPAETPRCFPPSPG